MLKTEAQRRWWFAHHPEFSWSRTKAGPRQRKVEKERPRTATSEEVDERWESLLHPFRSVLGGINPVNVIQDAIDQFQRNYPLLMIQNRNWAPTFPNPLDAIRAVIKHFERNHPLLVDDPDEKRKRFGKGFETGADLVRIAEQIARGHAYGKHVVEQDEYPEIVDRRQYRDLILKILSKPTEWKPLKGGRSAYWDKETGTVVIRDPSHPDGGTAFRPDTGKRFYDKDLK